MEREQTITEKLSLLPNINFVKYHYIDMEGNPREVTLSRDSIRPDGITSVDGSSVFGKIIPPTESDMLLVPDKETLQPIPDVDDTARVFCNMFYPPEKEGLEPRPFEGCPRTILQSINNQMAEVLRPLVEKQFPNCSIEKFDAHLAPEVEFLLLGSDYPINALHTDQNLMNTHYFIPMGSKEDAAMKDIIKSLGMMGLKKEKYHTEVTTHQHEIGMGHGNALYMADGTITLKYLIRSVASHYGLTASFIPKFRAGVNGSGMHVHQNLAATLNDGQKTYSVNLFFDPSMPDCLSKIGRSYIAGLLKYAREISALTNPLPISYKRLVPGCEAPTYIAWDWQNRTALCRGHSPGTNKIRVEYRAPDPTCNPYLAFAAMLSAGLAGIKEGLDLPEHSKRDYYHDNEGVIELPGNLGEALEFMKNSKMLRANMGSFIIDSIYKLGNEKWRDYSKTVTDHDIKTFF